MTMKMVNKPRTLLSQILQDFRIHWYLLALSGLFGMIFSLIAPELQKQFLDALNSRSRIAWYFLILVLLCAGAQWSCSAAGRYINGKITCQIFTELKMRLLRRLLDFPHDFFARRQSGYLTARVELDTAGMSYFYSQDYWQLYLSLSSGVLGLVILCIQNVKVGLGVTVALVIHFLVLRIFLRRNYQLHQTCCEIQAQGYGQLHSIFSNMTTIKTQTREQEAGSRIQKCYGDILKLNLKMLHLELTWSSFMKFFPTAVRGGILFYGVYQIEHDQWTLGELWALLAYAGLVFAPGAAIAQNLLNRESARAAFERIEELYHNLPEPNLDNGCLVTSPITQIDVRNLTFGYVRPQAVLADLSFTVNCGETLVISGVSGSGKTTLMSLLLLLYRPWGGEICFNGIAADQYNLRSLRRRIGYVCQTPRFFPGTLRENLLERETGTLETLMTEVGTANLIDRLDEAIEEDGANFSVGEKLRLAIVRELSCNSDILILDEPTANLDLQQEKELLKMLKTKLKNKILIIVTHRPKALEYADKIISLNKITYTV